MNERKLASVQLIKSVDPIEGADAIEVVTINGWKCVSTKGEFKEGDKCVYFEIDSYLPIEEKFEFLRKSSYKKMGEEEGFRLRTIRLRGQTSQGLALPITTLPIEEPKTFIGMDVTDLLGVKKYDPPVPACIAGSVVGTFPSFIPRTDEERIQNLPDYFETMKGVEFEETMKLDGTSMTVFRTDGSVDNAKTERMDSLKGLVGVCMRNYELRYTKGNTLWETAWELGLPQALDNEGLEVAIQGELMGNGIQGNRESLNQHTFFVFRIWDIKNQKFLDTEVRRAMVMMLNAKYNLGLQHVPVVNESIKIFDEVTNMDDLLSRADGKSLNHKHREGIVFKSVEQVNGRTISFKVISNKFLLKEK